MVVLISTYKSIQVTIVDSDDLGAAGNGLFQILPVMDLGQWSHAQLLAAAR